MGLVVGQTSIGVPSSVIATLQDTPVRVALVLCYKQTVPPVTTAMNARIMI